MRALMTGKLPTGAAGDGEAGCDFPLSKLGGSAIKDLVAALTGKHMPSVSDKDTGCPGSSHGDTLARGYVTVDTVTACASGDVLGGTYWGTRLSQANTLVGSFAMTHGDNAPAYGEQAVHIEASASDTRTDGAGDATFYGNLVAWAGTDHRERLPSMWQSEFLATRSDVIVWRDTKRTVTDPSTVGCSKSDQSDLDLGGSNMEYFNESEQMTDNGMNGGTIPFKLAAGRYPVGGKDGLPTPYRSGMISANLNFGAGDDPAAAMGMAQSVMLSVRYPDAVDGPTDGTLSIGTPLDDGNDVTAATVFPASSQFGPTETRPRAMIDPRPSASLVIPYFEVSLDDPNAAQTLLTVINTSATAMLAKVTLFTDRGVPTKDFNVYLTGYDIATIDFRMLFTGGLAPHTGSAGQDPSDVFSPHGPWSQDINFASCTGTLPFPIFDDSTLQFLRDAHTGKAVTKWDGQCGGRAYKDNVARGYAVIDTVNQCSSGPIKAADLQGSGALTGQDGLSGTFQVRNRKDGFSYASQLVHLHEVSTLLSSGDMTFQGWLDNWNITGSARREGLPNVWRVPFVNDKTLGSTELIFFRPVHRTPDPYDCGSTPDAFTSSFASLTAYDGNDNSSTVGGYEPGVVARRIPIGSKGIAVPYKQGSIELDLNFTETDNPPADSAAHMGYVAAVHRLTGSSDPVMTQGFPLHLAGEP
jgi:hypothetical protein